MDYFVAHTLPEIIAIILFAGLACIALYMIFEFICEGIWVTKCFFSNKNIFTVRKLKYYSIGLSLILFIWSILMNAIYVGMTTALEVLLIFLATSISIAIIMFMIEIYREKK